MTSATIRHAKAHLSDLIRAAGKGQDIIITNRGHPVARLVSVSASAPKPTIAETLHALAERGEIDPPDTKRKPRLPKPIRLRGGGSIVQTVLDQRR
jgi:prevent-host-death family protein